MANQWRAAAVQPGCCVCPLSQSDSCCSASLLAPLFLFYSLIVVPALLKVDFEQHVLRGACTLTVEGNAAAPLVLDTRELTIAAVHDADSHKPLPFSLGHSTVAFGAPLQIHMAGDVQSARVVVTYSTSPQASGAQWLSPAQTSGKTHPYLFTQCQAIHARSILPCQDTPGIKAVSP